MKAIILTIGNEVLSGQVVDTNAAWIAQQLLEIGLAVREKWSVADDISEIISALANATDKGEIIITTGGLGPTADDLTTEALAEFMKVSRSFHEDTFDRLSKMFASIGRVPGPQHKIQCMLPEGVTILPNNAGTAPGMYFNFEGRHLISMPGVPMEMKAIFDPFVIELLKSIRTGPRRRSHTFNTIGEGETVLEDLLKVITANVPSNINFAFLPDIYKVRVRVDVDSDSNEDILLWEEIIGQVRSILAPCLAGENEVTLEVAVGNLLKQKNWMAGTAESCTGGYLAHMITSIPGSSDYFKGGMVAYSNSIKSEYLQVSQDILNQHGAVSEETVKAMAIGAIKQLKVDVAVSVSGIAGPGGGTPEKPVGLVWIGLANNKGKVMAQKIKLRRDRLNNIRAASIMALILMHRFLLDE
ncbi:MAG: CinA family nicotinamide mononucleotide deamidase-related protein [Saprospiraceae bacterium]|jgi:nicotinamide-nucleotide amidase|nr:CinA family nicotinamide mononucleotide deamidase-related protein [Saprospiraceae bacterium]